MNVIGKVSNYTITEAKNGNAQAAITFDFQTDDGKSRTLTWYGSFAGGAKNITLKSLAACGLVDGNLIPRLIEGPASGVLDMNREVSLDIQTETRFDETTGQEKTVEKIQWVNDPSMAPSLKTMDSQKWMQYSQVANLASDFNSILNELNSEGRQSSAPSNPYQQNQQTAGQGYNSNGYGNQNQSANPSMQQGMQGQQNMQGAMPMNNGQAPGNAPF